MSAPVGTAAAAGETFCDRQPVHVPLPPVLVDREQLQGAPLNLASNARDAMAGQPDARLVLATMRSGSDRVALVVADNGPGMSRQTLDHAFEPFFSTKETGGGTGLGLAQVYGFAQQSGGTASIDSWLGVGVRVSLAMPAAAHEAEIEAAAWSA